MLRIFIIGCTCFSLLGCVGIHQVDRLPEEVKFRYVQTTVDLNGVFRNEGVSQSKEWRPLLSDVFFSGIKFGEPPEEIRIGSPASSVLRCEAMSQGKVLAMADLELGKDFLLADGGVQLDRKLVDAMLDVTGVGVGVTSSVIRLSELGDAVLTNKVRAVGLMLFIWPMTVIQAQDAIFQRVKGGEPVATDPHHGDK